MRHVGGAKPAERSGAMQQRCPAVDDGGAAGGQAPLQSILDCRESVIQASVLAKDQERAAQLAGIAHGPDVVVFQADDNGLVRAGLDGGAHGLAEGMDD